MDLQLTDRVFVLTGASKGLGLATAEALVDEGARVVLSSRSTGPLDEVVRRLGDRAVGIPADLADEATPGKLIDAATDRFGRLDGGLISVGGPPRGGVLGVDDAQWRTAFDSVFLGAVRMARALVSALPDGGAVAMVLSRSVKEPLDELAISNGLRPGLAMVVKTLAQEVGARGIRVNGLMPGLIETDRLRELNAGAADPEAARRGAESDIPLKRYGQPAEFGRVAAFLLSPAASYLSGAMIPVDGGAQRSL